MEESAQTRTRAEESRTEKQQEEAKAKAAQIAQASAPHRCKNRPRQGGTACQSPPAEPLSHPHPRLHPQKPQSRPAGRPDPDHAHHVQKPCDGLEQGSAQFPDARQANAFRGQVPFVKVKVFVDAPPATVTVISGVDGAWGFNAAHDAVQ